MSRFLAKLTSIFVALAICSASGAHWVLMQSVAWVGMVATFAQDRPLAQAVSDALDGQHPCDLCKAIADGKKSERKSPLGANTGNTGKVLLYFVADGFELLPAFERAAYIGIAVSGEARRDAPLLPPPRWR